MSTARRCRGVVQVWRDWTAAEEEVIHGQYKRGRAVAIARQLGRSLASVHHKARAMGVLVARRWTLADDQQLRDEWVAEGRTVRAIAREMNRTQEAIYKRAQDIGLHLGCPDGMEYMTAAAKRAGYNTTTMRMILRWAHVPLRRALSKPRRGRVGRPTHIVDPTLVDEAVADWCASEPLTTAARARDLGHVKLTNILRDFGRDVPPKPDDKAHWRIPTEVIDDAIRAWRRTEKVSLTLSEMAKRKGLNRYRMVKLLKAAGVARPSGKIWRVRWSDAEMAMEARAA